MLAALFRFVHKFRGWDKQEIVLQILKRLSWVQHYFFDRMMLVKNIFADRQVMKHRASMVSIWEQRANRWQMRQELHRVTAFA